MARFLPPEAFSTPSESLSLLPFNFERTGTSEYLVSNMVGDFIRLTESEIHKLVDLQLQPGDGLPLASSHSPRSARGKKE